MTMIDYSSPKRRNYSPLDRDKLSIMGDIAGNLESIADNTACLGDMPTAVDIINLNETLDRIAAALERLAGIEPAAADGKTAADTPTDNA